jgi:hypothetical protein
MKGRCGDVYFPHHLPHVNEHVRLKTDVSALGLRCGEAGSVCGIWFSPAVAFEVEFQQPGLSFLVRALLLENQIEVPELIGRGFAANAMRCHCAF